MKAKLTKLLNLIKGLIPERLPVGMAEFDSWIESFKATYDLPTKDEDSIRYTISAIILNEGASSFYRPKFYFYLRLCASAAKQIAGANFQDIKNRQRAAEAAAKAAAEEATKASTEAEKSGQIQ